jgi:glycogen debranching enzyme
MDEHFPAGGDFHIRADSSAGAIEKLVLKHDESFLVCDRRGDFPAHVGGELGFYHGGTRHLRWLELQLNGERPLVLAAEVSTENDQILVALANADIENAGETIPRNTIYLDRLLSLYKTHLVQSLTISSFHEAPCELTLEWVFISDFRDLFEVRGMHRAERGQLLAEEHVDGTVVLGYRGLDGVERTTRLVFDPPPVLVASHRAVYRIALAPNATYRIDLTATAAAGEPPAAPPAAPAVLRALRAEPRLHDEASAIFSDNELFNGMVRRSILDLQMLLTQTPQGRLPYAGVPWYVAPFGRDSLITAYQLLPYAPGVAAGTLRFLAAWQGATMDAFLDEEPGKILHEYRRGEMANCREIPFIPYYGTIDATPLFVMLLAEYSRWTGDLALVRELWPAARRALDWMRDHGDLDGDGYLEYATRSRLGLGNQGWKDSWDSVSHGDGALAHPPIALVEVQGYAYAALGGGAELARALGDEATAAALESQARALRDRFNRDFWIDHEGFYALALDGDKRPCEVISSNVGHCLWTGIVDEERAAIVGKRLLADDMFSGWGIRTLSARERRYNPMSYHNGSVWPHDNGILAAGFRRYGLTSAVIAVASSLFEASRFFEHQRIPELFCGFTRQPHYGPISYPVACAPQAWAAGSPLQVLTALCGLEAHARDDRLTSASPVLPPWLRFVEIYNVRLGSSSLDLAISQGRESASVELIARRGSAEILVRR